MNQQQFSVQRHCLADGTSSDVVIKPDANSSVHQYVVVEFIE